MVDGLLKELTAGYRRPSRSLELERLLQVDVFVPWPLGEESCHRQLANIRLEKDMKHTHHKPKEDLVESSIYNVIGILNHLRRGRCLVAEKDIKRDTVRVGRVIQVEREMAKRERLLRYKIRWPSPSTRLPRMLRDPHARDSRLNHFEMHTVLRLLRLALPICRRCWYGEHFCK